MNVQTYLSNRRLREQTQPQFRQICRQCLQPSFGCYCVQVRPFDPGITFVILNHPIEMKRRIATGRMTHLALQKSSFIVGQDYSKNDFINELVNLEDAQCVVLYPGPRSTNLTLQTPAERHQMFSTSKHLIVFVVDGTWNTARRMVRQSQNLFPLPRICFTPPGPSNFRVRKQPAPGCYSTIEAVHHTIELLGAARGFDVVSRQHDHLIDLFDSMVEKQLKYVKVPRLRRVKIIPEDALPEITK